MSTANKDIVFLLGSGRSGSSALTRVLSLCGCAIPQLVVGAQEGNPKGYWEPINAIRLNVEFLYHHSAHLTDRLGGSSNTISTDERDTFIQRIKTFLAECPKGPVLVVKEPKINELTEFWFEAARQSGFTVKVIIPIRHPNEYSASAAALHSVSLEISNVLWLRLNLLAERSSRNVPRVFVEYSDLVQNWRREIDRITRALHIHLDIDHSAVDSFLSPDLHRQRISGPVMDAFGGLWIPRVYSILLAAAHDVKVDMVALDEVSKQYESTAQTFRVLFRESEKTKTLDETLELYNSLPAWKVVGKMIEPQS